MIINFTQSMQSINYGMIYYTWMDARTVTNLSGAVYINYYGCLFARGNEMVIIAMLSFGLRSLVISI